MDNELDEIRKRKIARREVIDLVDEEVSGVSDRKSQG